MPPHPYTVALVDARHLPAPARIAAELRYAGELERLLDGADGVARTYRAWIEVAESEAAATDRHTIAVAERWPRAAEAAQRAGWRGLGDIGSDAHFEIRVPG